jgi:hypothetical protein
VTGNEPHSTSIHILDDDTLFTTFNLYRSAPLGEQEPDGFNILLGGEWERERWWHKLTHVCRRWRYLILGAASYLRLSLVCTHGTPVADMLAHSPPLPLIIDYVGDFAVEDEEGISHALQYRDRVCRIRLQMPARHFEKLVVVLDEEYPTLEYLYITLLTSEHKLTLPNGFQAPHLRHLILRHLAFPMGSRLLTNATGLVTLWLEKIHSSTYFRPNDLLQRLSLMPQLETLGISFQSPVPNRDVKRQLLRTPITTHVALPNLRWLMFGGVSAYLEALLSRMTAVLLDKLEIAFFHQLTFAVPRLQQFMGTTENLRFRSAQFVFYSDGFAVRVYPRNGPGPGGYTMYMCTSCRQFDWQVSSVAQIFDGLRMRLSTVEHLDLEYGEIWLPSDERHAVDRLQWRNLLRSFSNVKTLQVDHLLRGELSRCLRLDDGEEAMELFPELKELSYFGIAKDGDAFAEFIDARRNAGHPVTLICRCALRPRIVVSVGRGA